MLECISTASRSEAALCLDVMHHAVNQCRQTVIRAQVHINHLFCSVWH